MTQYVLVVFAAFFKIKRPDNVPATLQDRAYTSPIWYTPPCMTHSC
jgi:hypothetical protein